LPNGAGGSGIVRAREHCKIHYLPRQQLYRIVQSFTDVKMKTRTIFLPREWASFEIAE